MKTIRVQISDDSYEKLLDIQGQTQSALRERVPLAAACEAAFRVALRMLYDDANGAGNGALLQLFPEEAHDVAKGG